MCAKSDRQDGLPSWQSQLPAQLDAAVSLLWADPETLGQVRLCVASFSASALPERFSALVPVDHNVPKIANKCAIQRAQFSVSAGDTGQQLHYIQDMTHITITFNIITTCSFGFPNLKTRVI